jgi:hypothetical protein
MEGGSLIPKPFRAWFFARRRNQRLTLVTTLAPFYLGFAIGWLTRKPLPLFLGAIGMAILMLAYRCLVKVQPPSA